MKLFTIAFTLLLIFTSNTMFAQSYDTEVINAELYSGTIKRTGKLDYKRTLNLSFKNSGYLALLNIDEGDSFKKGDLLASLDTTELAEDKNSRYAQLIQAKREVKRISRLMDEKMASERDMDSAMLDVATKRAAYQVSFYNLEKAQISAPFDGIVLTRSTELGEMQSPGQHVLKIAKLEWVIKVALTGLEVSQVKLSQQVNVSLSHMGLVEGVISKIPATANAVSNLFTIEVLLPNIETATGMIAGQFANVNIDFQSEAFVYRLPIAALVAVDDDGKAIVVAKSQGTDFKQYSFDVFQLDNNYVYLMAKRNDSPLQIITRGWQNYSMGGN